jgi:hypothetical protein
MGKLSVYNSAGDRASRCKEKSEVGEWTFVIYACFIEVKVGWVLGEI